MAYQQSWNAYVAAKKQTALGSQATGASAGVIRVSGGPGGRLSKAAVESQEIRRDGQRSRGRHGTQKTAGNYMSELVISSSFDNIIEALGRGTYSASDLAVTEATAGLTSITTTTGTIVASAGSWVTAGVRAGEIWRLTGHSTAANNDKNLIVTGATASTLTIAGAPLTANAVADTAFTLTRTGKKLILPDTGAIVSSYWTIEEYEVDIDGSEVFTDCMWGTVRYNMQPNGIITVDRSWVGTGQHEVKTGASAPHFTSPTISTSAPMSVADASIYVNGAAVIDLTAFDLTFDLKPSSPDTFGSAASRYAPDVFTGQAAVSMNITALRKDLTAVTDFNAETEYSLVAVSYEQGTEPRRFHLVYVPNFTLGGVDKSPLTRDGTARTVTLQVPEALVGKDDTGGGRDPTMIKWQTSIAG